jgi:hypothetical protein
MNLFGITDKIKNAFCKHRYEIRYDERYDLGDEKHHTFRVTYCRKCGKIKSIEQMQ